MATNRVLVVEELRRCERELRSLTSSLPIGDEVHAIYEKVGSLLGAVNARFFSGRAKGSHSIGNDKMELKNDDSGAFFRIDMNYKANTIQVNWRTGTAAWKQSSNVSTDTPAADVVKMMESDWTEANEYYMNLIHPPAMVLAKAVIAQTKRMYYPDGADSSIINADKYDEYRLNTVDGQKVLNIEISEFHVFFQMTKNSTTDRMNIRRAEVTTTNAQKNIDEVMQFIRTKWGAPPNA